MIAETVVGVLTIVVAISVPVWKKYNTRVGGIEERVDKLWASFYGVEEDEFDNGKAGKVQNLAEEMNGLRADLKGYEEKRQEQYTELSNRISKVERALEDNDIFQQERGGSHRSFHDDD